MDSLERENREKDRSIEEKRVQKETMATRRQRGNVPLMAVFFITVQWRPPIRFKSHVNRKHFLFKYYIHFDIRTISDIIMV